MEKSNKPKHQHFIPKSYLKNFSIERDKKYFIETLDLNNGSISEKSINDICVKKNLYTITNLTQNDKYYFEKFYAKNVDNKFPETYNLLTNPSIKTINKAQKFKIIYTILSFYFRTPKFVNSYNKITDDIINESIKHSTKNGIVKFCLYDKEYEFSISETENVKKKFRNQNKTIFLYSHLKFWKEFVSYKINCGISVYNIVDDMDLITSDNPIIIENINSNNSGFNLYDPSNIIQFPLDKKNYLYVFPNSESSDPFHIYRGERDKMFAITSNFLIQSNADKWILGFPNSLNKHLQNQKIYNEETTENLKILEDSKNKAQKFKELIDIMNSHGFFSQIFVDKVKEFRKFEYMSEDIEFKKTIYELVLC
ncbi:MAG: DUF4238 domain-containing protein [Bacteroidota bacterium]